MKQPTLFDLDAPGDDVIPPPPDQPARDFAVDPANDVVLEASAGTGKTRVLVDRYVRLVSAGVDPRNILAITFTRKAAAEMRDRVLAELRRRRDNGTITPEAWRAIADRLLDIQISTIDAFCFALLREFPLEARVDPAFEIADETDMARFSNEAIELTLRLARSLMVEDERVRLLCTRVKTPVLAQALRALVDRRHIALRAVAAFVGRDAGVLTAAGAASRFVARLRDLLRHSPHRTALVADGPAAAPGFHWLASDLAGIETFPAEDPARVQQLRRRLERYFLTKGGDARQRISKPIVAEHFASPDAKKRHEQALAAVSPIVLAELERLDADVNMLLARGLLRVLTIAVATYERLLDDHGLLDFAGMLDRSVALLERQEEFARSRLKLQARYHHVLVDEFQDTSRQQWRLIDLLVGAWSEGAGLADAPTSIFIVGDRKQSIYRFRHAEVTLLEEAARRIAALRQGDRVRQTISTSFRAVPELLAFVNAVAAGMHTVDGLDERFTYDEHDRFPLPAISPGARRDGQPVVGLIAERSMGACAEAVADEVARLIGREVIRDRTGASRPVQPDDVAILFRARAGHQYFEDALELRGIRTYVYKGLGFFDAPEVQDLQALLGYLARPDSDLRAAELLRSRLVRLSDIGLSVLAPSFAATLRPDTTVPGLERLGDVDRALLTCAREHFGRWCALRDRVPPGELLDLIVSESAYLFEIRGRRLDQARENIKKVRALVRRIENRGYATLARLAEYFDTLRAADEANAVVDAAGAVNLMTMHAAKGLEYPIVFLVNLHAPGRGRPAGFSVIERGPSGEPEVAFNSTEATKLEERRESEELRRLLYVAMTRARDRLYLAAEVDDNGKLRRPARSLASLLPLALADTFSAAAQLPAADDATWSSTADTFDLRICRPQPEPMRVDSPAVVTDELGSVSDLVATTRRIVSVTKRDDDREPGQAAPSAARAPKGRRRTTIASMKSHERVLGSLVHRMFQHRADYGQDRQTLAQSAEHLLTGDERVDIDDIRALTLMAADLYVEFRRRPDVSALVEAGTCFFEVPFCYDPPDRPAERVRGFVDCLVESADGHFTVVEFKTGKRRPEHEQQSKLYAAAMRQALGRPVKAVLVYPEPSSF